jgi:hypothetical protein
MRHGFSAFALNDLNGFLGRRQIDVSTKYPRTLRANATAVALPLPQPGPIDPAPTTSATLPLSRSAIVSAPVAPR